MFSRTLPLIRYEMTDQLSMDGRECPCGRRFLQISGVEGRLEDVLTLPGSTRTGEVHPITFHRILDTAGTTRWQVRQEPHGLTVLLAGLANDADTSGPDHQLQRAHHEAGARGTAVRVRPVDEIPRTALGKAPPVQTLREPASTSPGPTGNAKQ